MNAHNPHSTDLDRLQQERIDPDHHRHLALMFSTGMLIGVALSLTVILTILNSQAIHDFMGSRTGVAIFGVTCSVLGISWLVWTIVKQVRQYRNQNLEE